MLSKTVKSQFYLMVSNISCIPGSTTSDPIPIYADADVVRAKVTTIFDHVDLHAMNTI